MHMRLRIGLNFTSSISRCWFDRRELPRQYNAIDLVRRLRPGMDSKQRPQTQEVKEESPYQEDHLYHAARIGRIQTEMCRPYVKGLVDKRRYGGFDHERLRVAGLARTTGAWPKRHSHPTSSDVQ